MRDCDLLRHDSFRGMRPRQLSAPRDDDRVALETIAAGAKQHIDHVSPEPISTIEFAAAVRSADTISYGASAPVERGCCRPYAVASITTSAVTGSARSSSTR